MKTQQELQLHYWGPLHEMVKEYNQKHGSDVKPWECVKCEGDFKQYPKFTARPEAYTFAITILYDPERKEHRPVFVGDKLYLNGQEFTVGKQALIHEDRFSWVPPAPKRTFKLSDMELPCPEKRTEGGFLVTVCGETFAFSTFRDCYDFKTKLMSILTAARDQE